MATNKQKRKLRVRQRVAERSKVTEMQHLMKRLERMEASALACPPKLEKDKNDETQV